MPGCPGLLPPTANPVNFKTTLLLIVLLAAATGGYLWVRTAGGPAPAPPDALPSEPLVTGTRFSEVRLTRGDETLVLENDEGRWWQTAPVRFPVRRETVEAIVNAALSLAPRQSFALDDGVDNTVVSQPSDDTTGLDQPAAVLTLVSESATHTLELGRTSIAGTAYLRTPADRAIHLVDPALHRLIERVAPANLWPPVIPTLDPQRVDALDLRVENRTTALRRTTEGWTLGTEADERADDETARRIVAVGTEVPVLRYVGPAAGALDQYGLNEPSAILGVGGSSKDRQTLRVGAPADLAEQTRYASWSDTEEASPVVFVVSSAHVEPLWTEPDALRDPRIVTALPESIRGQHVNRVGRDSLEIAISRAADGTPSRFAFVEPSPGYSPDPELAPRWLTLLTTAPVRGYSRAPREAQAPVAVVELKLAGGRSEFVRLYADRDGRENTLLAVRENEAVAALVGGDVLAPLLAPVVTLRDRALPATPPLSEVRLQRDDGHEFVFVQGSDNGWDLVEAAGQAWELVAFDRLRQWIESPRVVAWTAMSELPRGPIARLSTGPDQPAYVVNVDQNLGQRTDLPGVFRLPPDIGPLLAHEYRSRMLLPVAAEDITRVQVWSAARAQAFAQTAPPPNAAIQQNAGGAWVSNDGTPLASPERWSALPRDLAGLSAKRYFEGRPDESPADLVLQIETRGGDTHTLIHFEAGRWAFDDQPLFIDADLNDRLTDPAAPWNRPAEAAE